MDINIELHHALYAKKDILPILGRGANVNFEGINKETPLHIACKRDKKEHVIELLNRGAKVNAEDNHKQTPLHVACQYCRNEIIVQLLNHGANVNAEDTYKQTPLHYTYGLYKKEMVVELLTRGTNYHIKNIVGFSVYDTTDEEMKDLIRQTMIKINWKKAYRIILLKIVFDRYKKDFLHRYYLPNGKGYNSAKIHFKR